MTEPTGGSDAPAAAAKPAPPKPAARPAAKPPRELPTHEGITAWVRGEDLPVLAALFDNLILKKFDALVMQIRKEELVPQHWQLISREPIDESAFDRLPEVAKLRRRYGEAGLAERRLAALHAAWIELGGKQPSLWTVSDLLAAMRRLIDKKITVDFHDLLSVVRDVWAGLTLPHGQEQLGVLWACLDFVREKTKK